MASDRARVSYDPSRQYRSVVMQQGRVTLDADVNEEATIEQETLRAETLDIVGPAGTPDNGFEVTAAKELFDIHIGPGTMYVGGWRVFEPTGFRYGDQPEWLDRIGDPMWRPPELGRELKGTEAVLLFLREQEVSATEDRVLREVALGGPDTAQRTRLIRRIVRLPTQGRSCDAVHAELQKVLPQSGVSWNQDTLQLESPATLQVIYVQPPAPASVCDPPAQGGYLGADNQLIRVQITGVDANSGRVRFVWGYNNASFLYRVTAIDAQTLELESSPIDSYHTPKPNKAIEVLRAAVPLGHDDYIAAHAGVVQTPTQAFVPETRRLVLPTALPAEYVDPQHTTPLFLRLWEQELTVAPGTAVDLPGTGLQVVISLGGPAGTLSVGQFWMFAVRPSTPTAVYPQRYLDAPQPPEGPRMWLCPLAVIAFNDGKFVGLDDCRPPFDNLVELTKRKGGQCCSLVITPADVTPSRSLQQILDGMAGTRATLSLQAGLYELTEPLKLGPQHSRLTLEGCQDGAVIGVKQGSEEALVNGLIQMDHANEVTFRSLRFHLRNFVAQSGDTKSARSIGLRPVHCANLTVEDCLFRFSIEGGAPTTGIGVLAASEIWNPRFTRNRFLHEPEYEAADKVIHSLAGFGLLTATIAKPGGGVKANVRNVPLLDNAVFEDNEFAGLTVPVFIRAVLGRVRIERNLVRLCRSGFQILGQNISQLGELVRQSFRTKFADPVEANVHQAMLSAAQPELVAMMDDVARVVPLPARYEEEHAFLASPLDSVRTKELRASSKTALTSLTAHMRASTGSPVPGGPSPIPKKGAPARDDTKKSTADDEAALDEEAVAGTGGERQLLLDRLSAFRWVSAAAAERAVSAGLSPAVHVANNEMLLLPIAQGQTGLFAGLSVVYGPDDGGTVMLMGNRIRGSFLGTLVSLQSPAYAIVSANLFINEPKDERARSFMLVAAQKQPLVSVIGNGFQGFFVIVPPRQPQGPPDSWDYVNSRI